MAFNSNQTSKVAAATSASVSVFAAASNSAATLFPPAASTSAFKVAAATLDTSESSDSGNLVQKAIQKQIKIAKDLEAQGVQPLSSPNVHDSDARDKEYVESDMDESDSTEIISLSSEKSEPAKPVRKSKATKTKKKAFKSVEFIASDDDEPEPTKSKKSAKAKGKQPAAKKSKSKAKKSKVDISTLIFPPPSNLAVIHERINQNRKWCLLPLHQTNAGPNNTGPPIVIQTTNPRPINKANCAKLSTDFHKRGVFNCVVENAIYIICPFSKIKPGCLSSDPAMAQALQFIEDTGSITIIIMNGHHRVIAIRTFLRGHVERLQDLFDDLAKLKTSHASDAIAKFAEKQASANIVKEYVEEKGLWLCSVIDSEWLATIPESRKQIEQLLVNNVDQVHMKDSISNLINTGANLCATEPTSTRLEVAHKYFASLPATAGGTRRIANDTNMVHLCLQIFKYPYTQYSPIVIYSLISKWENTASTFYQALLDPLLQSYEFLFNGWPLWPLDQWFDHTTIEPTPAKRHSSGRQLTALLIENEAFHQPHAFTLEFGIIFDQAYAQLLAPVISLWGLQDKNSVQTWSDQMTKYRRHICSAFEEPLANLLAYVKVLATDEGMQNVIDSTLDRGTTYPNEPDKQYVVNLYWIITDFPRKLSLITQNGFGHDDFASTLPGFQIKFPLFSLAFFADIARVEKLNSKASIFIPKDAFHYVAAWIEPFHFLNIGQRMDFGRTYWPDASGTIKYNIFSTSDTPQLAQERWEIVMALLFKWRQSAIHTFPICTEQLNSRRQLRAIGTSLLQKMNQPFWVPKDDSVGAPLIPNLIQYGPLVRDMFSQIIKGTTFQTYKKKRNDAYGLLSQIARVGEYPFADRLMNTLQEMSIQTSFPNTITGPTQVLSRRQHSQPIHGSSVCWSLSAIKYCSGQQNLLLDS
ncbi:hypothetical protein QCA50_020846 [Cerrena zonata]|uniref:Uncharacterized protein n=1 Tax=Cerrena zonata TaxID=2478898 RepID=A0AAW0FG07_9APHY